MGEKRYKKLIVWQKADELAYQVYIETKKFPKEEIFGITSQLRRAALSVPNNLVEGYAKQGSNSLRQYANIALGSLGEVEYLFEFCLRLGYFETKAFEKLESLRCEVGRLLWKLYASL
jgi:four helix bundle protein